MPHPTCRLALLAATVLLAAAGCAFAGELRIGAARVSITPPEPVALAGQVRTRIAREVESPATATALALESRDGETAGDQAVMVSLDLVLIRDDLQPRLRERLKDRLPGLDPRKIFLTATHTHTAPVTREGVYVIPEKGVMQPAAYVAWLVERLEDVVARAWEGRKAGGVAWGLGHALVAHNRRAVYAGGSARMYGNTNDPAFRGIEGYEDHYVDVLFFTDSGRRPVALAVNVPCPSQEVESRSAVNADFWHETRLALAERFGEDVHVVGWPGAAGDQSPHLMWYKRAEERMRNLRGLSRLEEIARRIDRAVAAAWEGAKQDVRFDVPLIHRVQEIPLPVRKVTEDEFKRAKAACDAAAKQETLDPGRSLRRAWNRQIVDRYETQDAEPFYTMELHAVRLGDVAVCTNPFELYTEYGVRIRARSRAVQTFVVQLTGAAGGYLPTAEAVRGGGYSTAVFSNRVGPEGGNVLVDRTVETLNALWEKTK
ncbi:MAG: hypothetical protein R6X20_09170 [Phycisphaerae bacterium]